MENLGVDIKILIAQIINFGVFFFIFSKLIAHPFMNFIANEKKKDQEKQKLAEMTAKQELMLLEKEKELKEKYQAEFDKALKEAKREAESVKEDLIKSAEHEAKEIVDKAQRQIKDEQVMLEKQIKEKVSSLSVLLVQNTLSEYLTDDMQKAITERLLTNLPKNVN